MKPTLSITDIKQPSEFIAGVKSEGGDHPLKQQTFTRLKPEMGFIYFLYTYRTL